MGKGVPRPHAGRYVFCFVEHRDTYCCFYSIGIYIALLHYVHKHKAYDTLNSNKVLPSGRQSQASGIPFTT